MKQSILLSIILSLIYGNIPEKIISKNARVEEAISFIQVWLDAQRDYEGIPGISIAIVHDQELLWSGGFGFSDSVERNPTTSRTIHSICSISKLFTSIAIMQLRDKGELSLEDPIKKHLPWFNIENTYPEKGDVTIKRAKVNVNGPKAAPFYKYLTRQVTKPKVAGKVSWNFEKFVIDRKGKVIGRFGPRVAPDDPAIQTLVKQALAAK